MRGQSWQNTKKTFMALQQHFSHTSNSAEIPIDLEGRVIVEKIRKRTGMDRILFGTDYPASKVMPGGIGGVIRCYLTNLWLTDAEKEKILYHNAAGLIQLQS